MIALDIEIAAEPWQAEAGIASLCRRAADSAFAIVPDADDEPVGAALLLADDAAVRELNRRWRGEDKPTNVLSFPSAPSPETPRPLGDVVLAYETVAREARETGIPIADHTAHLVVHGILHLVGFDHGSDPEAEEMERLETRALATLGIADPYREPA